MTARTKWIVLGGLGTCWVLLGIMRWLSQAEPQQAPLRFKSGQRPVVTAKASAADGFEVKQLMPPGRDTPADPKKNIFTMNRPVQQASENKPMRVRRKSIL